CPATRVRAEQARLHGSRLSVERSLLRLSRPSRASSALHVQSCRRAELAPLPARVRPVGVPIDVESAFDRDPDETMQDRSRHPTTVNAHIAPVAGLDVLSRDEVARLRDAGSGGLHELLRRCALAVLTQGTASDDARALLDSYPDFDLEILQQDRGVKLELTNA